MPIFGWIKGRFLKRRLANERKYDQFLQNTLWCLGAVPQESVPELALTPDDRHIISNLDNLIVKLHNSSMGVDLLDVAEALMIKGFILRVRGVDLGGLFAHARN